MIEPKTSILKIEFTSYWHCGRGRGEGIGVDMDIRTDDNNCPFIPGKTVKGVLREMVRRYAYLSDAADITAHLFGSDTDEGNLEITSARLDHASRKYIQKNQNLAPMMSDILQTTAINESGIAKEKTLRTYAAAVPMILYVDVTAKPLAGKDWLETIEQSLAFAYIGFGTGRRRGLGRCKMTIESIS